ncbi:uncharacterized protein [Hyperolius riggenbachi]|uniref:uncharacterized protein n=1 Tax=Hyperolius riggenbachi TaxID=752182 RepID=UPI0035A2A002
MEQPWYRQYFWLLVFGGIILFTGIITLVMICVCRAQFSKRVTVKIQQSFRKKKRQTSTIITDNSIYRSTAPHIVVSLEKSDHKPDPGYCDKRDYINDRYSCASYDSVGHIEDTHNRNAVITAISQRPIQKLPYNKSAAAAQMVPSQSLTLGVYPEYCDKRDYINDRYSSASYDSVEHTVITDSLRDREYVEVIEEDYEDYDDVEIISTSTK